MREIIIPIVTSLLSGLVGVLVGCWQSRRLRGREEKVDILKKLITYQFLVTEPRRIEALNLIPLAFSKSKKVCNCFEDYKKLQNVVTGTIGNPMTFPDKFTELGDTYVKLVETIAKELHYEKSISWDKIRKPYIPKSYMDGQGHMIWY